MKYPEAHVHQSLLFTVPCKATLTTFAASGMDKDFHCRIQMHQRAEVVQLEIYILTMFILFMQQSHDTFLYKVFDRDFSRDQFLDPLDFFCSYRLQHLRVYTIICSSTYFCKIES